QNTVPMPPPPTPPPAATVVSPASTPVTGTQTQTRPRTAATGAQNPSPTTAAPAGERLEPDDVNRMRSDVPVDSQSNRREMRSEEEAAVLPYYQNYLSDYRLGPEDVISIIVFGQPNYSRAGIAIPPNGVISHQLIPGGIFVAGKTTTQVENEMKAKLDEYIIDPIVTVALEKAMSARYGILGDIAQPGVRVMSRRLSVYEAIVEAGGVTSTADKKKVYVLRRQANGTLQPIPVNIAAIEKGRAPDLVYLSPGDQVVVPGNTFKKGINFILGLSPIINFARIFTGGF
ncbi:MAG: polysaccharide export protein, partial [Pyrinomonadaceae bacterium]|nr:polysaccharide export protein [Pyrinomonadaceae bacterium]